MYKLPDRPLTDDELLTLLNEVEGLPAHAPAVPVEAPGEESQAEKRERPGAPCPHCAEPALETATCVVCEEEGCLPRDDWLPGDADPCLTRCARCGHIAHGSCSGVDFVGNPACAFCKPVRQEPEEAEED